ncbi:MAG: hypothetical protein ACHQNE_10560, partial [Candidatus Kapaibacterium sp.]
MNKYQWNWNVPVDSSCGFHCSEWMVTDIVVDGLQEDLGLDSISVVDSQNMTFTLESPVKKGMPRDSFTVCVKDTMQNGRIIVRAKDIAGNISYDTITYCTIADTKPPIVTITSVGNQWLVQVRDTLAWDRGIKQVLLTNGSPVAMNWKPIDPTGTLTLTQQNDTTWLVTPATCQLRVDFYVSIIDSFKDACFAVQATDCADNTSNPQTACKNANIDNFCPKIEMTSISPWEDSVTIYDIHLVGSDTINFDEGIDSIWFSCANNITLDSIGSPDALWVSNNNYLHALHGKPTGGDHPKFQKVITFTLSVTDTSSQDSNPPCVCINAIDGAGHPLCVGTVQWCSSVNQDTAAPKVTAVPTCTSLDGVVTDSETNDRGIHRVWLDNLTNFAPLDDSSHSGDKVVPITLQIPEPDSSSYARLNALDVYGNLSTLSGVKAKHTTSTDVWIYKQDLGMAGSGIAETNTTFNVPVYLTITDGIPLGQKQLSQFQFTFQLTGSTLVKF